MRGVLTVLLAWLKNWCVALIYQETSGMEDEKEGMEDGHKGGGRAETDTAKTGDSCGG